VNKERYFTPDNIGGKASEMLSEVKALRERHKQTLRPEHSALLILDMQRYFLEESSHAFIPAARAIIPGIVRLIDSCSQKGLPIIFTRHLNTDADAGMMSAWWRELIREDNTLNKIAPELDTSNGVVLEKSQYDAFHETSLEEMLRERRVSQVIVCGVMTHLCCETTARAAFVRGLEVFFAIDGTATYSEAFHRATLLNLAHGFAVPVLIEEIVDACNRSSQSLLS